MNRKSNEISLKEALAEMVQAFKLKPGLYQNRVKSIWEAKMGTTIASQTREIRLFRRKLFLSIDSATIRQELLYSKEKIVDMLNEELGEEYIQEVIIR